MENKLTVIDGSNAPQKKFFENKLAVVDIKNLSPQEITEIDKQVDDLIERHKDNRYEINSLVFDGVAALTASKNLTQDINSQGTFKRFLKRITGENASTQDEINKNLIKSQYAIQQILQKIAEKNLMTFELIAAVNNKLNAHIINTNIKVNDIYYTMSSFLKNTRAELVKKISGIEQKVNLLTWQNSIEYQIYNGVEYRLLDDATKIVCIIRDFNLITGGKPTTSDLLLLKSAMATVGIDPNNKVNYEKFISQVGSNILLYDHLFDDDSKLARFASKNETITLDLRKAKSCAGKNFISISESKNPTEGTLKDFNDEITFSVAEKFLTKENINTRSLITQNYSVNNYEFIVDLFYNLEQLRYAKAIHTKIQNAAKLFMNFEIKKALPILDELASRDNVYARYILAIIYNEGLEIERNSDLAKEILDENILSDDACSIRYGIELGLVLDAEFKNYLNDLIVLADNGGLFAQYELAKYYLDQKNYPLAIKYFDIAAGQNYFLALHNLGLMHFNGQGVEMNYNIAKICFTKAAEIGYSKSMLYLGNIYWTGDSVVTVDKKCAAEWYMKAYDKGIYSDESINRIGNYYNDEKNYSEALKWWHIGEDKNFSLCLEDLANAYYLGEGVEKNYQTAIDYFKRSIETGLNSGYPEEIIGDIYFEGGYGVTADKKQAAEYYKKAYKKGIKSDETINRIGNYYNDEENYSEALKWWHIGEENNYPLCISNLGWAYRYGKGVDENYQIAADYFKRSIEAGSNSGYPEKNLGDIYFKGGFNVTADKKLAIKWYKKAYEKNFHSNESINRIGKYYNGKKNYSEALKWWNIGADNNYHKCLENLGNFYYFGNGADKDYKKAVEYFKRAIAAGSTNGYPEKNLGDIYLNGLSDINVDKKQAVEYYKKAYEKGIYSDESINCIGNYYNDEKQSSEALKWWRIGEDKNYPSCLFSLGLYHTGSTAIDYFKRSIEAGLNNGYPEEKIGNIYLANGNSSFLDKEGNFEKAVEWYEKARAKGINSGTLIKNLSFAEFKLGDKRSYSFFENIDYNKAIEWYLRAYEHGQKCIHRIADCYDELKNYDEAIKWLRKGKEENERMSIFSLAYHYKIGKGVTKNYSTAIEYFKLCIIDGNGGSEYYIAEMYLEGGYGITANRTEAVSWYWKAANKGDEDSRKWLIDNDDVSIFTRMKWLVT